MSCVLFTVEIDCVPKMGKKSFIDRKNSACFRLPNCQTNDFFEALCNKYADDIQETDEEMDRLELGSDCDVLQQEQITEERFQRELPDPALKEAVLRSAKMMEERDERGQGEQMEAILLENAKKCRWDCESVLSTHSILYNHPTEINEPRTRSTVRRRMNKLKEMEVDDSDCTKAPPSVRTQISTVSLIRPKGETAEERRTRKNAVKEERRERRKEKKMNKDAFRAERLKLEAQRKSAQPMTRPIH